MEQLKVAEVKGLKDMKAFQVNEYDTVAAYSLEEAKTFYLKHTGMDEKEAFYDFEAEERSLDEMIWEDETRQSKQSIKQVIQEYWDGSPFIVCSTVY